MAAQKDAAGSAGGSLPLLTESVTVAKGRTLQVDDKQYGPGAALELDVDEAKRLRALGYLVNPTAAEIPVANGPTFAPEGGPTVTQG